MALRNIYCNGTITLNAPVTITGCYFTGAVVINNIVVQSYDTYIIAATAGIVPITINGASAKYQHFLSTIAAVGDTKCIVQNDGIAIFDVCQMSNSSATKACIESIDGQLIILNSWVINMGGGNAIVADNGATVTATNAISNIFAVGDISLGTSSTVLEGKYNISGSLSGTGIILRSSDLISNDSTVSGDTISDALDSIDTSLSSVIMDSDFSTNGLMTRTGAGSYSITTLPSGAIVGTTDTQTLTNKTLTSPKTVLSSETVGGSNGDAVYLSGSHTFSQCDASAEATSKGLIGIRVSATEVQIDGIYTTSGLTAGSTYYLSETVGAITTTAPSTSGAIVRIIGYALSTTELLIKPSESYVEVV